MAESVEGDVGYKADDFRLLDIIGTSKSNIQGYNPVIHLAEVKSDGTKVAIKVIPLEDMSAKDLDGIRREITTMKLLSHEHVVKYLASFLVEDSLWLVMSLMGHGPLKNIVRERFPEGLGGQNEILIASLLKPVLLALQYFHSTERMHRNIRASHILIHNDGSVAISDFSVATYLMEKGSRQVPTTSVGEYAWRAPEACGTSYGPAADIWSVGITAIELAVGYAPLSKVAPQKAMTMLVRGFVPSLPDGKWSSPFRTFVDQCCQVDPKKRPSASKLLDSKFIRLAKGNAYIQEHLQLNSLFPMSKRREILLTERREKMLKEAAGQEKQNRFSRNMTQENFDSMFEETEELEVMSPVVRHREIPDDDWNFDEAPSANLPVPKTSARSSVHLSSSIYTLPALVPNQSTSEETREALSTLDGSPTPLRDRSPVEAYVGETGTHYVVFVRAIPSTSMSFRLSDRILTVTGALPPLPIDLCKNVVGLRMLDQAPTTFERKIELPGEVNRKDVEKETMRKQSTIVIRIAKKQAEELLGDLIL